MGSASKEPSGLSSDEISRIMFELCSRNRHSQFLGVFAFDELPRNALLTPSTLASSFNAALLTPDTFSWIVNTDPASSPGQHWLAFVKDQKTAPGQVEFFDSYGESPESYKFFIPPGVKILRSHTTLQSLSTNVCGHYCILFLYLRATLPPPKNSFLHIIAKLHTLASTPLSRDRYVKQLVANLYRRAHGAQLKSPAPALSLVEHSLPISTHQTCCTFASHLFLLNHNQ